MSQFAIPYVTLITHYAKSSQLMQPKYELILIAVTYNLASIAKIDYKDTDNNGIFIKVRDAQEEDDEGEEGEPAQDQVVPILGQVVDVLGRFSSVWVTSTLDLTVWMSVFTPWVLKWLLLIVN